jgi:aminoglycoside 3-N-acetyltransferase
MRSLIHKLTPGFLHDWFRGTSKKSKLAQKIREDETLISKNEMLNQLKKVGIVSGDVLLVYSNLNRIGKFENGEKDVVDILLELVGENGHLLIPNSPVKLCQLEYVRKLDFFDVVNSKSAQGEISEYFRLLPDAIRSEHPTEPVSCIGLDAEYFVGHHFGSKTPYNENSPFYRVAEQNGKILCLGMNLGGALPSLLVAEDLMDDFKFPSYFEEEFEIMVRFENRTLRNMVTRVHDPKLKTLRRSNALLPLFIEKGIVKKFRIGKSSSLLLDAKGVLNLMQQAYKENGVTLYSPKGS